MDFLNRDIWAGNTVKSFIFLAVGIILTFVVASLVQKLFRKVLKGLVEKSKTNLDNLILMTFEKPVYWFVLAGGFNISLSFIRLGNLTGYVSKAFTIIFMIFIAWSLHSFVGALRTNYMTKLDPQLANIVEKTLKAIVWILCALVTAGTLDVDIASLIAGLSIGGLALSMAAKDTLSNIFGSVTLFADKPFKTGDMISIGGTIGTVEDVGLRTFHLRTLEGTLITYPNAMLVGGPIENITMRPDRRYLGCLSVVYSMTTQQLKDAMEAIREILKANPRVRDDFSVRIDKFADSSIDIGMLFWVTPAADYFDVVSEVFLACKEKFDKEGWDFAFPSLTLYQDADSKK